MTGLRCPLRFGSPTDFTSTLPPGGFFFRWVTFSPFTLCRGTLPQSTILTTLSTLPHIEGFVASFGFHPATISGFKHRNIHDLGNVYKGPTETNMQYPGGSKFSDEGSSADNGDFIHWIEKVTGADKRSEHFVANKNGDLTQVGLSRINQFIEAFVYSVLRGEVNFRSSILEDGGRAKEARTKLLALVEDAVGKYDISKNVQVFSFSSLTLKFGSIWPFSPALGFFLRA